MANVIVNDKMITVIKQIKYKLKEMYTTKKKY